MKKGEVSQVVETEFGYHLIKVTDRKEPGVVALDQVRQKVASYLDSQNKEKQIGDFLTALRKTATIDYGTELRP
jgi:peptidyl-prolyl cis-trans isomerase C